MANSREGIIFSSSVSILVCCYGGAGLSPAAQLVASGVKMHMANTEKEGDTKEVCLAGQYSDLIL